MAYRISDADCIACGVCEPECPVECIFVEVDEKRKINEEACIDCGACADVCPVSCIAPA